MKSILGRLGMGLAVFLTFSTAGLALFTYTTNADNTLTITGYSGGSSSVIIPSNFNGKTVTRLGDVSLRDSLTMTSVVIPDSITNIGASAFYTCTKLTGVAIPNSVTRLGNMAFMNCYNLSSLSLGNGISSIEDETFRNCTNLLNVAIPDSVVAIGSDAFNWCLRMTNLTLGTGLKNIYGYAFRDCDSLKSITIPGNLPNSGFGAFAYCDSLRNVIVENGVKTIGEWSFLGCGALTNVTIPSSVTKIDNGAFDSCTNLRDTTIPVSVTVIGGAAFAYCSSIKNVTIPDAVTGLGGGAFQNCTALTNVAISANVRILSNGVFSACSSLKHIAIPNSVRNIEDMAFMSCTGLTNVLVGSGVTNLGISVFNGCGALRGAYFSGNAPRYGQYVFDGCVNATVYRLEGATGWPTVPNPWAGRPTAYWSLSPPEIAPPDINVSSSAATGKIFYVITTGTWTAVTNVPWIAITAGTSGSGNGTVTFSVATNSAASRTGGIVVAGGGISLTCTVVQAGVPVPSAPTGVTASVNLSDRIQVSWASSAGATGYTIWRNTNNVSGSATNIASDIVNPTYDDLSVPQGITHYYWVKATNASGASGFSTSASGLRTQTVFSISGMVYYEGAQTGFIHVTVSPNLPGLSATKTIASPGAYSVTNALAGEYNIWAYRDSNGNGSHDPWEAYGTYLANPLSVNDDMANIDITLQDPTTDSDGDGISDYDEVYVHGTLWNNPDSDDDGMPDGDEILAGSSPTNDASMFGFADALPVPEGGGVVISWPSLSNRVYRLERSTNLLLGFEPYADGIPADPPMNTYTDDTPNVLGAYKVGVRME